MLDLHVRSRKEYFQLRSNPRNVCGQLQLHSVRGTACADVMAQGTGSHRYRRHAVRCATTAVLFCFYCNVYEFRARCPLAVCVIIKTNYCQQDCHCRGAQVQWGPTAITTRTAFLDNPFIAKWGIYFRLYGCQMEGIHPPKLWWTTSTTIISEFHDREGFPKTGVRDGCTLH